MDSNFYFFWFQLGQFLHSCTDAAYLQVLLSDDGLKLMIEEASVDGRGAVDLETYISEPSNQYMYVYEIGFCICTYIV